MRSTRKKKKQQLKMHPSTAAGRLRKMIMFDMMQALELTFCYQCGKKIARIEELSVEHKIPWLDSDDPVGLYFNLNNIAFSHLSCNVKERRNGWEGKTLSKEHKEKISSSLTGYKQDKLHTEKNAFVRSMKYPALLGLKRKFIQQEKI